MTRILLKPSISLTPIPLCHFWTCIDTRHELEVSWWLIAQLLALWHYNCIPLLCKVIYFLDILHHLPCSNVYIPIVHITWHRTSILLFLAYIWDMLMCPWFLLPKLLETPRIWLLLLHTTWKYFLKFYLETNSWIFLLDTTFLLTTKCNKDNDVRAHTILDKNITTLTWRCTLFHGATNTTYMFLRLGAAKIP